MSSLAPLPNPEALVTRQLAAPDSELDKILESRAFEKTPTLKKLLTYLWHHRNEDLNEYAIATEALGRRPDFEPRLDATVRVLISRLRQRLKEFYEAEGAHYATRIVIPLGTHQVQVVRVGMDPPMLSMDLLRAEVVADPSRFQRSSPISRLPIRRIAWIEFFIILALIASNIWTMRMQARQQRNTAVDQGAQLPGFWRQFLNNSKSTRIIVPNPVFFGWPNGLMARDKSVNDFSKRDDSAALRILEKNFGPPRLSQQYVASSDTFASLRLQRYLDPQGNLIRTSTTAEASPSDLDRENIILVGTPNTLSPLHDILDQLSLKVDTDNRSVIDRKTGSGIPLRFDTVDQSGTRMTTPGIIACLPGGPSGTHVMVLMTTYYTSALVSYITSEAGLKELRNAQAAHGNGQYFEAVVVSEIDGSTALSGKLALFRPFNPQPRP